MDNEKWNSWFYKSSSWIKCRDSFIKNTDGLCECCKLMGKLEPGVIAHHHIPLTPENIHDVNITLNHDNLHLLCIACHNKIHYSNTNRLNVFDDKGDLINVIDVTKFIDASYLNNGKRYYQN